MSELTKKSIANFLASVLKTFGILIITFTTTPLILKRLGDTNFGVYKTLTELHSYLSLIEVGLLASIVAFMVPLLSPEKKIDLELYLGRSKWAYIKIIFYTLIIGICLTPMLPNLTSYNDNLTELYLTYFFILITTIFLPANLYRGYLDANNRGYIVHFINLFQSILLVILTLIFAYSDFGMKSQSLALFIAMAFGSFLLKKYSGLNISTVKDPIGLSPEIVKNRKYQVLNELAHKLCQQSDQIILGFFLGPLTVTKVFIGQRIVQIFQIQFLSLGQATWPSLLNIYNQHDHKLFEKRFIEMTKVISVFSISCLVPTSIMSESFIKLWVGDAYSLEINNLVNISSICAFFLGIFSFWATIFAMMGKSRLTTKIFWSQAIINILASLIATKLLKGIGPVTGSLISNLLAPLWMYPLLINKELKLNLLKIINSFIPPLILGIMLVYLSNKYRHMFANISWLNFFIVTALIFIITITALMFLCLNNEERKIFINRVESLILKKAGPK